jgi:hypothetical protein
LFAQLGIVEEFLEQSKPCEGINVYDDNRELQFTRDFKLITEM